MQAGESSAASQYQTPVVNSGHALSRLFHYARSYRSEVWLASLLSVVNKFFDILPEVLIGVAVDTVIKRQDSFLAKLGIPSVEMQIFALGGLTALIWIFESATEYGYSVKWRNLAQRLQHDLRLDAYNHVQQLPLAYFEDKSSGNILATLNDDINQLERFLNGGANDLIQVFASSIIIGLVFFILTPGIAVLALSPVPLILLGTFYFQRKLAPRYAAVRDRAGLLNARLNNNLAGIATIKAYSAESFERNAIGGLSDAYKLANREAIRWSAAITPVIRMAVMAGFIATLVYGGWLTLHDQLAVGAYSILIFLTQRLLWPFTRLADITDLYQRSVASIDRVLNLLSEKITIAYAGNPLPVDAVRGDVSFEGVSFAYAREPVLHAIDLKIPAGQEVALVGSTGAGKSTIVKLLMRFYEPQAGRVRLDGHDINTLDLKSLRRAIGFVSQDIFLLDGTVAENIAYGTFDASPAAIEAATRAAEAHAFIAAMPNGYATRVGERGQKLSDGQRQRLALARALVRNPPILIFDEATSAVDNETEAAIARSMAKVTQNRMSTPIACRRYATPTAIVYSIAAPSSSKAPMNSCWREAASTPACGNCRPARQCSRRCPNLHISPCPCFRPRLRCGWDELMVFGH